MHLLLPLASILGIEVEDLLDRFKQNAIAWLAIAFFAAVGVVFVLGFFTAYWAMLVTIAAEQFGTNLRATVATSVPNFVRGATVLSVLLFGYLRPEAGIVGAAEIVGIVVSAFALDALFSLRETFHVDLDYIETDAKTATQKV